jgi:hypothetical protein
VTVNGGTITDAIYGGYTDGNGANNNTVKIGGGATLGNALQLFGGNTGNSNFTGNTLVLDKYSGAVKSVANFEKIAFTLPDALQPNSATPVLTVTSPVNLTNVKIADISPIDNANFSHASANAQTVTLLSNTSGSPAYNYTGGTDSAGDAIEWTLSGGSSLTAALTPKWARVGDMSFGPSSLGYTTAPVSQDIRVTSGDGWSRQVAGARLESGADFTVGRSGSTWAVRPRLGLQIGVHADKLIVTFGGNGYLDESGKAIATVRFEVVQSTILDPVTISTGTIKSLDHTGRILTISYTDGAPPVSYDLAEKQINFEYLYNYGYFSTPAGANPMVSTGRAGILPNQNQDWKFTAYPAGSTSGGVALTGTLTYPAGGAPVFSVSLNGLAVGAAYDIVAETISAGNISSQPNPSFRIELARNYLVDAGPQYDIAVSAGRTPDGRGITASATVTSGSAPASNVIVTFDLINRSGSFANPPQQRTTGAAGLIEPFVIGANLPNGRFAVAASTLGREPSVSETIVIDGASSGNGGGCDAGFGALALAALGCLALRKKR